MLVPDRKGNLRIVYNVSEPVHVHNPLMVANFELTTSVSLNSFNICRAIRRVLDTAVACSGQKQCSTNLGRSFEANGSL
jgi:hypothetical protein